MKRKIKSYSNNNILQKGKLKQIERIVLESG